MNSKERFYKRLEGKKTDRIPNLNILMMLSARIAEITYKEYCTDYRKLVEADLAATKLFDIDILSVISDPMREVELFGGRTVLPQDDVPYAAEPFLKDYSDIKKLRIGEIDSAPRALDRVKAAELFFKEAGDEYPICGWVEGPVAEASDLRDINRFMEDLLIEPQFASELMDICVSNALAYAKAQIDAGCDIIGVGDAAASLIGPGLYKEMALEHQTRLLKGIKDLGALTKLHICGNTTDLVELIPVQYVDIFDIDWMVDYKKTVRLVGDKVSVNGNFDPVSVLLQGDEALVRSETIRCVVDGNDKSMVSAGCEVPKFTPEENLKTVSKTLADI